MAVARALEAVSSSASRRIYDVFLSFRGEDTRKTFTDHLYCGLVQAGFRTFGEDDAIPRGESLEKAIQQSRVSIIVLSKNYASSPWCLDELAMILDQRRTSPHVVLPVFYDVNPSQIRKQAGRTAEAFARFEEQLNEETDLARKHELKEKLSVWSASLRQVADLTGFVFKNQTDAHESKFIQDVVRVVGDKLSRVVLSVAPHLIGIHSQTKRINSWLQDMPTDVRPIAICGMGGIGKTTLAKVVYNQNFNRFEGSSFLLNVREISRQPNGLIDLQRKLLTDILNKKKTKIGSVAEGLTKIKDAICFKKVLVVLDDVDQADQLNAIVGMREWICPGSKIIITTRHEWLLKPAEGYMVHRIEILGHDNSIKLFSLHAFGQDCSPESYTELTRRVVHHCGGLPLALQVLGSFLNGKNEDLWVSALEKLEVISNNQILKILKISYDSLEDHDKKLFLDIACFFVGKERDIAVKILDECDFFTAVGIENLIDHFLLEVGFRNKLMMHQLVQDMGREIIRQESPEQPGKRSRLWRDKDSFDVLRKKTGTEMIGGLVFDMRRLIKNELPGTNFRVNNAKECHFEIDAFARLKNLRLLLLNYVQLTGCYKEFPKGLRWLCWHGFPLHSIPNDLSLESLVHLDMSYSRLKKVWNGKKIIQRLKILDLSHSQELARTPDFSGLLSLEKLFLKDCASLVEVSESIGSLEKLVLLDLADCKNLRKLPRNTCMLKSLETLIITGCSKLCEFPTEISNLVSLKVLHGNGIAIKAIPPTNTMVRWLEYVPSWAQKPRIGPEILWSSLPHSLVKLSLVNCNLLEDSFPSSFSNLSLLLELNLSENLFHSLPYWITSLSSLKLLSLESCHMLQSILGLPSSVKNLNIGHCVSLEKLTFQSARCQLAVVGTVNCHKMVEIEGFFKREPIGEVVGEIINNLGIDIESMENLEMMLMGLSNIMEAPVQGLYEFGIFSTFLPEGAVPSWFSHKNRGSSISFTVPSLPYPRIRCLNVCFVYADPNGRAPYPSVTIINNKTKGLTWIYCPLYFGIPNEDEHMVWLSQWNFGNQFEGGDEVTVSMVVEDSLEVNECGISIVYNDQNEKEEEENHNQPNDTYFSWNEVIGGDLSCFKLSTGVYFLCRRLFDREYEDWELDWFQNTFGHSIDFNELQRRNLHCGISGNL